MADKFEIGATDALIVVDVQNDFCPGGSLPVNGGDEVVPVFNRVMDKFAIKIFTRDWHPPNHVSFADEPQFVDKSWPSHCVMNTKGAEFHPDLKVPATDAIIVSKATDPAVEAYSEFEGTDLAKKLRENGVRRIFIGGLATDYCVKATVLDALKEGFESVLIEDASRGIDVPPGNVDQAIKQMKDAGAIVARSEEVV